MPKPGYTNTPYGPVLTSSLGKGPTVSQKTSQSINALAKMSPAQVKATSQAANAKAVAQAKFAAQEASQQKSFSVAAIKAQTAAQKKKAPKSTQSSGFELNDPKAPWNQGDWKKFKNPLTAKQYWSLSNDDSGLMTAGRTLAYFTPVVGAGLSFGNAASSFQEGDVGGGLLNAGLGAAGGLGSVAKKAGEVVSNVATQAKNALPTIPKITIPKIKKAEGKVGSAPTLPPLGSRNVPSGTQSAPRDPNIPFPYVQGVTPKPAPVKPTPAIPPVKPPKTPKSPKPKKVKPEPPQMLPLGVKNKKPVTQAKSGTPKTPFPYVQKGKKPKTTPVKPGKAKPKKTRPTTNYTKGTHIKGLGALGASRSIGNPEDFANDIATGSTGTGSTSTGSTGSSTGTSTSTNTSTSTTIINGSSTDTVTTTTDVVPTIPNDYDPGRNVVDEVKVVNPSNFIENYDETQSNYATDSLVLFNTLSTSEILEVARNYEVDTSSININPNILDIVNVVNTFAPTEIVKLQQTSNLYFGSFGENLEKNSSQITQTPGLAEIKVPQKNENNSYKIQVQIIAPKTVQRGTAYPIA